MQQEQHEADWRFPVFILVEPDDVERDAKTGLLSLKKGFAVEVYQIDKPYACLFTSKDAIQRYVQFSRCPTRQPTEIENAHDFIRIFGEIIGPEVADVVVDFSGDLRRTAVSPIQALLDLMRRMVADQLDGTYGQATDLPHGRKRGPGGLGEGSTV